MNMRMRIKNLNPIKMMIEIINENGNGKSRIIPKSNPLSSLAVIQVVCLEGK